MAQRTKRRLKNGLASWGSLSPSTQRREVKKWGSISAARRARSKRVGPYKNPRRQTRAVRAFGSPENVLIGRANAVRLESLELQLKYIDETMYERLEFINKRAREEKWRPWQVEEESEKVIRRRDEEVARIQDNLPMYALVQPSLKTRAKERYDENYEVSSSMLRDRMPWRDWSDRVTKEVRERILHSPILYNNAKDIAFKLYDPILFYHHYESLYV